MPHPRLRRLRASSRYRPAMNLAKRRIVRPLTKSSQPLGALVVPCFRSKPGGESTFGLTRKLTHNTPGITTASRSEVVPPSETRRLETGISNFGGVGAALNNHALRTSVGVEERRCSETPSASRASFTPNSAGGGSFQRQSPRRGQVAAAGGVRAPRPAGAGPAGQAPQRGGAAGRPPRAAANRFQSAREARLPARRQALDSCR